MSVMFHPDSLYGLGSVSPPAWEELENISLPSLPFELQFPDTPLQDEADLLPMLEPGLGGAVAGAALPAPVLLQRYCDTWAVRQQFSRLHVLVCGYCSQVFHLLDQFRQHSLVCDGRRELVNTRQVSVESLARLLWVQTGQRLVQEQTGETAEGNENLTSLMESFFDVRMEEDVKKSWLNAAASIIDLNSISDQLCKAESLRKDLDLKEEPAAKSSHVKRKYERTLNCLRDDKGRWASEKKIESKSYSCEVCKFSTATEWKLKRHENTQKHMDKVNNCSENQSEAS